MEEWMQRTSLLLGEKNLQHLQHSHILVVGVGGVGAYAAEMLVRAGVGHITIIDSDCVAPSNINRQLIALHSTIDKSKVDVLAQRLLDINPALQLTAIQRYVDVEWVETLLQTKYDFVVDAIDTVSPRLSCWQLAYKATYPSFRRWEPVRVSIPHRYAMPISTRLLIVGWLVPYGRACTR